MSTIAQLKRRGVVRLELIGLAGVVERNLYLVKRYIWWDVAFLLWTIANTLTIVFIARGVDVSQAQQNDLATKFLVGGVIWAYLGIDVPDANYAAAVALLGIASISFIGIGMMTAVLPLISPEKGTQLGFI